MELLIQQLINGLALGSTYALIALGYTMVYGIIQLINFAHGEFFMLGAYAGVILLKFTGLPFYLTVPLAVMASIAMGAMVSVGVEKLAYKPLREKNAGRLAPLITAIGFSFFFQNVIFLFEGADLIGLGTHNPLEGMSLKFGGVEIALSKLFIFIVSILLVVILVYIVHKTKTGKAMRAVSFNKDNAMLMGVNPNKIISFTFALGGGLAGIAGLMFAIDQNQASNFMGFMPGLKAFIAAVVGGIGSISGAMIGGLLLGVLETLAVVLGMDAFKDGFAFILLILILLFKPSGLLLKSIKEKV